MSDAVTHHDKNASEFLRQYDSRPDFQERLAVWESLIAQYAPLHGTALDLGCGGGILTFALADHGLDVTGVDGSAEMIRKSEERAASFSGRRMSFVRALLPGGYAGPAADVVVTSSLLEYLEPDAATDGWLASLVRPGGVLIFSLPNRSSLYRYWERSAYRLTGRPVYRRLVKQEGTARSIAGRFVGRGFRFVEARTYGLQPFLARVGAALSERLGATMIVAVLVREGSA